MKRQGKLPGVYGRLVRELSLLMIFGKGIAQCGEEVVEGHGGEGGLRSNPRLWSCTGWKYGNEATGKTAGSLRKAGKRVGITRQSFKIFLEWVKLRSNLQSLYCEGEASGKMLYTSVVMFRQVARLKL